MPLREYDLNSSFQVNIFEHDEKTLLTANQDGQTFVIELITLAIANPSVQSFWLRRRISGALVDAWQTAPVQTPGAFDTVRVTGPWVLIGSASGPQTFTIEPVLSASVIAFLTVFYSIE